VRSETRQAVALAAVGAAGSAVLRWLLAASSDPFAGTLTLLPLVVAGLLAVDLATRRAAAHSRSERLGAARRVGAWRVEPTVPALEAVALFVLVALVLLRSQLGLQGVDGALAAAFLLLLAQRVGRQVLALRPLLGRRLPERPSVAFFLLPLVVYLALLPWSSEQRPLDGDEPYYLLITHSLAYDFDADLTNNYAAGDWSGWLDRPLEPQPGDPVGSGGELYSRHNEALPLLLVPAYRVAGKVGALAMMAALTAALAWMVLRLAYRYWPQRPGEALAAWALFAFSPPLLLYSYQVWVEVPAALLSMIALDRILSFRGRPHWGLRPWLLVGVPVVLLPLVKIRFMLLAVPLVALAWWYAGRPRKPLIVLTVALVAVGGGILVHNQLVFDNPLKIHQVGELELTEYPPSAYLLGAMGLFWDSAFGLFACAPLWLLLLPAVLRAAVVGGRGRRLLVDLLIYTVPYLLIVVPRNEWYGGWSPPFRYALVALPLLALLLIPLLAGRRRGGARVLVSGLLLATVALTLLWVIVPGWTYNFADGRTYLLDHLSARLGTDVARLFPSSVRPRTATWVWPPLTLLLSAGLWWWPGRRRPEDTAADGRGWPSRWWHDRLHRWRHLSPRRAAPWAAALLLAAVAVVPWAASRLPTRVVEFEDPWVGKSSGNPYPRRWIIERTRYRGGWVLREGGRTSAPIVPGGPEVTVHLDARFIPNLPGPPVVLEVRAGSRLLGTVKMPRDREWVHATIGPARWPPGTRLVVVAGERRPGNVNGVILDRAVLDWK